MTRPLIVFAMLALATASFAQSGPQPHGQPESQGAIGDRLEPGASSFTEAQVREKFERMGFGAVTDLRKDDEGIWRGKAQHAGRTLAIGMDFKGRVAAE